jgi:hypothetical protein
MDVYPHYRLLTFALCEVAMTLLSPRCHRSLFIFLVALILTPFALQFAQAQSVPPTQNAPPPQPPPPPPPLPATDQQQFLSYWTTETGWHTELQLRNNQVSQILTVTPVLRAADGTETPLFPVVVQPQEVRTIDVATAIGNSAPQLIGTYGSVALRYRTATKAALYAVSMIMGVGHSIAFHIDATGEDETQNVGSREGIWWLPNVSATGYLVLTNQGQNTLQVNLSLFDASGKFSTQTITLAPRAMNRYSIRQIVAATKLAGSYGGIKVSATAHAGSLDTLHVLFDENGGFSAVMKMFDYDPSAQIKERDYAGTGKWTLRAPMLALSNPDPALAFPVGTTLQPQLLVRNTTSKPVDSSLTFNWRTNTTTGQSPASALHLNPNETRRIDVAALQDGKILPQDAQWASVTLATSGLPDEVVAVAASYDQALHYGAQTPFSDQLAAHWVGSQWEYDPQHDSIITVGNGGTKPTQAAFSILYNQGTQKYQMEQTLQPGEQMWMDIGKLIRENVPDKNGKTLPADLTSGSYEIRDLTNKGIGTLFEGKIIYDKTYGHVTYGCSECCGFHSVLPLYNPLAVPDLGTAANGVHGADTCTEEWDDVSYAMYGNWTTANTGIATVDYYGTVTGHSIGSTTSSTFGYLQAASVNLIACPNKKFTSSGTDNTIPNITSISPDSVLVGSSNVQLTIAGGGFGSAPTVNLPSGVTKTGQASSDSQIIITVNTATSATIGPTSITVTNTSSNLTSNQSPFTVDGPFYLTVVSDQLQKCSGCSTTVQRLVKYQVMNVSNSTAGTTAIGENPTDTGWSCTQTNPGVSFTPCSEGATTDSSGQFTDSWTLKSDGWTPIGCGFNTDDHWMWCPTGRSIGHLNGYIHTNAVSINGVVNPPTSFTPGTVINP